jgi:hypothetical protein
MMSNLFVSMGSTHCSLCRTTLAPAWRPGTSQRADKHHTAVRPEDLSVLLARPLDPRRASVEAVMSALRQRLVGRHSGVDR